MKAVRIHDFGGPEQFRLEELPDPVPGAGEILVRVRAASLNPVDSYARQGYTKALWSITLPAILGVDAAGTVEAVGPGVQGFRPGDRVIGRKGVNGDGTHAEKVLFPETGLARLPDDLSFEQGATLPLAILTARQLVAALGDLAPGERVLVSGALGSVGRAAVQALKERGAVPVAGVRAERLAEGEALAGEAVDLGQAPGASSFDHAILAAAPAAAIGFVRDGGRAAAAVQVPSEARRDGVEVVNILAHDDADQLRAGVEAAGRGELSLPVARTYPLADIAEAHRALDAHPQGKIVVTQ